MGRAHPFVAAIYDLVTGPAERGPLGEHRTRLLRRARGRVLEVGAGTGINGRYYRDVEWVVATEPDPAMRRRMARKLVRAEVLIEVVAAEAESLPFPDAAFDTVVATLVFCTVRDPAAALGEVRRVLRPGGRLLFLEHVRGADRHGRWQDRVQPVWSLVAAGCHPNRDTVASIRAAGFHLQECSTFELSPALALIQPLVEGVAEP